MPAPSSALGPRDESSSALGPQAGGKETGEHIQCWVKDRSEDSKVKKHGRGVYPPCWGECRAARRASWRRKASSSKDLKNQQKPPVKKGGKEFQTVERQEEAQRREGQRTSRNMK